SLDGHGRKQKWNRRARLDGVVQRDAVVGARAKVPRHTRRDIVAADADALDAMVKPIERRRLELPQTIGDDAASPLESMRVPASEPHVDAVKQQMAAAKTVRVGHEIVE